MGGGTAGRDTICLNLRSLLRDSLRGTPCRPHGPVFRVRAGNGNVRYPVALIECGEPRGGDLFAAGSVAMFKVYDAVRFPDSKMSDYDATPSIRNCIVIQAGQVQIAVHGRNGSGHLDEGSPAVLRHLGDVVSLSEHGVALPLADLYERALPGTWRSTSR